jgi:pteridine reductase
MHSRAWKNYLAYAASKNLLAHLTTSLAHELAPHIRVNAVAPGAVKFPADWDEEKRARILDKIPLRRTATTDEVASAVVYLACDATYTTGEIFVVDGGRHLVS